MFAKFTVVMGVPCVLGFAIHSSRIVRYLYITLNCFQAWLSCVFNRFWEAKDFKGYVDSIFNF